ncbi:hypothetical protein SWPG_00158 [Synechococcus phage S-CBM2]|nr:hypothetical protein SWPG_00158 [Synechococcus phage S-CBM2]
MNLNDFSSIRHTYAGRWSDTGIYKKGDIVKWGNQTYVCTTNVLHEKDVYGNEYSPRNSHRDGFDYWKPVQESTSFRGRWGRKKEYQRGELVEFQGKMWLCEADNRPVNDNPVYLNGGRNPYWRPILTNSRLENRKRFCTFGQTNPLGWTRNLGFSGDDDARMGGTYQNCCAIDDDGMPAQWGRTYNFSPNLMGLGENYNWATAGVGYGMHWTRTTPGLDFYDWYSNRRRSITGDMPRCVQMKNCWDGTAWLFDNGEMYYTGYNAQGQRGDGQTTTRGELVARPGRNENVIWDDDHIMRDHFIIKMDGSSTGGNNKSGGTWYALTDEGRLFSWGSNNYGQVGDGWTDNRLRPYYLDKKFFDSKRIIDMYASGNDYDYVFAVDEDGELWAWGYNGNGGLGIGSFENTRRPVRVKYDWARYGGIKKIINHGKNAYNVPFILTHDGTLHVTGYVNEYGMLSPTDTTATTCWFQPLQRQIMANLQKEYNVSPREVGNAFEVWNNVDDFWVIGNRYYQIIVKEKNTGAMYTWGYSDDYSQLYNYSHQEADTRNQLWNTSTHHPKNMMLDMQDVRHIGRSHRDGNRMIMAVDEWGKAIAWGDNNSGSRGQGNPDYTIDDRYRRFGQMIEHTELNGNTGHPVVPKLKHRIWDMKGTIGGDIAADAGAGFILDSEGHILYTQYDYWYYNYDWTSITDQSNRRYPGYSYLQC